MSHGILILLTAIGFIVLGGLAGGLLSGLDRFITARMQGRQGPPVLQAYYDLYKLFKKRGNIVNRYQTFLLFGCLIFMVFMGVLIFSGSDLLLAIFTLSLAELFLCMTASTANGPYSSMGAQRGLVELMCVEPTLLIMAICYYLCSGSFMVSSIVSQSTPAILRMPGVFVSFVLFLIVEMKKSPFDISTAHHAHQEMVKGVTTDISGNVMGISELAEWYKAAIMFALTGLFFVTKNPLSLLGAVAAGVVMFFLLDLIDNVFPRVKWEVMFKVCWGITFVFGGANLLILMLIYR